jgi:hypothetical protein
VTLSHRRAIDQRRKLLLARLSSLARGPLMRGSIVERLRRCGKSNCACATDASARHGGLYLSVHLDGATQAVPLRAADVERVRAAVEQYQQLWLTLTELTECELSDLRRSAQERRRGRARRRA